MSDLFCPLCNSAKTDQVFVKDTIPYYKCFGCHFRFSLPETNANLSNNLSQFEKSYFNYFEEKVFDGKNFVETKKWMISCGANVASLNLLDVGCGSGKFVSFMVSEGLHFFGIEPSQALYDHFLKGKNNFFYGSVEEHIRNNPLKNYDVITAFDVLEHVKDPQSFLSSIFSILAKDGLLFISTPDADSFSAKLFRKKWHFYNRYHLSYFSKEVLNAYCQKHGLKITHYSKRAKYISAFYLLSYAIEFLFKTKFKFIPKILEKIVFPIYRFDTMHLVIKK